MAYPEAARARNIQGNVVIEVKLDNAGNVSDAHVVAGPDELRSAALQSVLEWHFAREAAGGTRQVTVAFQLPQAAQPAVASAPPPGMHPAPTRVTLKSISITGISDAARSELLSRLPVHEGDVIDLKEASPKIAQTVKEFNEHLIVSGGGPPMGSRFRSSRRTQSRRLYRRRPPAFLVGGAVQQSKLISQPRPVYPPEAKAAGVQGVVRLKATIATDGTIKNLELIEGHPLLAPAAMDAVKQWVYEPTLLAGNPVEVITQIDVNYTLSQ